jgi:hypothetical protein
MLSDKGALELIKCKELNDVDVFGDGNDMSYTIFSFFLKLFLPSTKFVS